MFILLFLCVCVKRCSSALHALKTIVYKCLAVWSDRPNAFHPSLAACQPTEFESISISIDDSSSFFLLSFRCRKSDAVHGSISMGAIVAFTIFISAPNETKCLTMIKKSSRWMAISDTMRANSIQTIFQQRTRQKNRFKRRVHSPSPNSRSAFICKSIRQE